MKTVLKSTVYRTLDNYKTERTIRGGAFSDIIVRRLGRQVYPTVVLKIARHWAYLSRGAFDCIDREKSVYRFTPGRLKVSGTFRESLPVESRVKEYKRERELDVPR